MMSVHTALLPLLVECPCVAAGVKKNQVVKRCKTANK